MGPSVVQGFDDLYPVPPEVAEEILLAEEDYVYDEEGNAFTYDEEGELQPVVPSLGPTADRMHRIIASEEVPEW